MQLNNLILPQNDHVLFVSDESPEQCPFNFRMTGCLTNGLWVKLDIFQAVGVLE